jgi:hypothetical protein
MYIIFQLVTAAINLFTVVKQLNKLISVIMGRDRLVGVANGYGLDDRGVGVQFR